MTSSTKIYINCASLSLSIFSLYINKKSGGLNKIFLRLFKISQKSNTLGQFVILSIHEIFLWSCEVLHKIWARLVQSFWRILDTNRQTSKVYNYMYHSAYDSFYFDADPDPGHEHIFKIYCFLTI